MHFVHLHHLGGMVTGRLIPAVLVLLVLLALPIGRILAAGTISGMVFRDINMDGVRQVATPATTEPGVAGITVTARDELGNTVTTTTRDGNGNPSPGALGTYTLPLLPGNFARVEITGLFAGYHPSAIGTNSTSLVMFVDISGGNVSNVDAALYHDADYCGNPRLTTSCFIPGNNSLAANNGPTIAFYDYFANGINGTFTETTIATANQTGTVFGLAYQTSSQSLFSATYVRRGAGQGPTNSTGTIYRTDLAGNVSVFLELNGFAGINTGVNPHPNAATPDWIRDPNAFAAVGKVGLGDLELSEDEQTLYVMNLFQRELIVLPLGAGPTPPGAGAVTRVGIPNPATCTGVATDVRPFALKFHDGQLYVGMVCTAESLINALNPATANINFTTQVEPIRAAMRAYVYQFNPATNTFGAAPALDIPLNYSRGQVNDGFPTAPANDGEWLPWVDVWFPSRAGFPTGVYPPFRAVGSIFANPQPMLTDIEFDDQGFMMLGFRDRFADQAYSNGDIGPTAGTTVSTRHGGDILLACQNTTTGVWQLESGGTCLTRTGASPGTTGPGGGEFYFAEFFNPFHLETGLGGLGHLPGSGELVSTVYDSFQTFEAGTITFSNTNGSRVRGAQIFPPNTLFRKGGGLGDVELICNAAPIQIGNRVWRDEDADGVQDPNEPPLAGVTVQLFSLLGAPMATAVTDANGNYYFSSGPGTSTGSAIYGIAGLTTNTNGFEVRINTTQTALVGFTLTTPDNDASASGDSRDSDGILTGANAVITVNTGGAGANNHTYDFGFIPPYGLGNRVWLDNGAGGGTLNNGIQDGTEPGIANVQVLLLDGAGNPYDTDPNTAGVQQYLVTTDANGYYRFDNLPSGDYIVEIIAANFAGAGPLANFDSSTGAEADPDADVDRNDNGLDVQVAGATRSGVLTLGDGAGGATEPLGETDLALTGQGTLDGRANMTVDFGFVRVYSLGNRVWLDDGSGGGTFNDGIQNGTEPGIANIQVRLLDSAGNPVDNPNIAGVQDYIVTTDASGHYRFDNLTAGDFIVEIVAANFTGAGSLNGFLSSNGVGQEADPDANVDLNDNGLDGPVAGAIRSGVVSLGDGAGGANEPTGETDLAASGQGTVDNRANMTVDFGFIRMYSLGNRIWNDDGTGGGTFNDGLRTGGELGVAGVTLQLLDGAGNPVDGDLNTPGVQPVTTTTDALGYYRFDNLYPGNYIVEVAASNFNAGNPLNGFLSSTGAGQEANPNSDVDNNDNGLDTPVAGAIRSGVATLGPGTSEPTGETDLAASGQGATDNRANMTVDFGFYPVFSLGNRVWFDGNNSGTIDAADGGTPGIPNVQVRLLDNAGNPVDDPNIAGVQDYIVTTDANGHYRFDNLLAGDYIVEIIAANFNAGQPLENFNTSTGAGQEANPNANIDSNDNGLDVPVAGAIRSGTVTLGPGNIEPLNETDLAASGQGAADARANMTVDFGFYRTYSLGNRVWIDDGAGGGTFNDGLLNGAETGVAGINVRLLTGTGVPVDNPNIVGIQDYVVTTDASGYYRFDNLLAGDYIVEIVAANFTTGNPLNGFISSTGAGQEANPNANVDNNDNGLDVPVAGGIRSGTVTLGDGAGGNNEPINEADLGPGGQGAADNQANMTVDFGFIRTYSLGNRVWQDDGSGGGTFDDGIQNGTEPGIANVQVRLLDSAGNPYDSDPVTAGVQPLIQLTDAQGYYRFDNLPPADYIVEIMAANFAGAGPLVSFGTSTGAEADPDSDVDRNDNGLDIPVAGGIRSGTVTLGNGAGGANEPVGETDLAASGQGAADNRANMTVDFGFIRLYSLGNRVWNDLDNSGTINGAETGIAGVTVRLLDAAGNPVDGDLSTPGVQEITTVTSATGHYRFDNLRPGDYIVEVIATNFTAGNPLNGATSSTGAGQEANPNADVDSNDNGLDTPVAGAIRSGIVTLGNGAGGTNEPTGETDISGGQGAVDNRANMTVDFGFTFLYSLGNRVWNDIDNSGNINGADGANPGIPNIQLRLLDNAGNPVDDPNIAGVQDYIVTTDANGHYRFDSLVAGTYIVEVVAANFNVGQPLEGAGSSTGAAQEANPDFNVDSNDNGLDVPVAGAIRSGTVTLGPGDIEPLNETDLAASGQGTVDSRANMTVDFGFLLRYSLGNRVWLDTDNSGSINGADGGTPGIANVQLRLLNSAGTPVDDPNIAGVQDYIVTTDANGYYRFDNLPAGDYVVEVLAANFNAGQPLEGLGTSTGAAQEANPNADVDSNDNGLDTPVAGSIRSGTVTLGPGSNEPLAEADLGPGGQSSPDARANMTVDFGFTRLFSLGNRVWRDDGTGGGAADNGIQDGTEPGISAVTLRLLDNAGNPVDDPNLPGVQTYTVVTNALGYYRFDNLRPGDYVVEVIASNFTGALNGLTSSSVTEANPNADVDVNDNGLDTPVAGAIRSGTVTLGPTDVEPVGETAPFGQGAPDNRANMTVDFGFVAGLYSLGNRVWLDADNSGTINPADGATPGIDGVQVRLLDSAGNPADDPNTPGIQNYIVTTAGGGYYRFDNLPAGTYLVEIMSGNFSAGQPLNGLSSSTGAGQEANPNADVDNNDNGLDTPVAGGIRSGAVTLGPAGSEPLAEGDIGPGGQGSPDNRANMTVDFGFFNPPDFSLGNRVWRDLDNDGTINLADGANPGIGGVTVRLLDSSGTAVIATTTTDANGYYRFDNLPPGDYLVEVTAGNFSAGNPLSGLVSSSGAGQEANPNSNVDSNDNGLDVPVAGAIRSGIVTLGPTASEPLGEGDLGPGGQGAADANANMTVDFGFTSPTITYSLGNRVWRDNGAGGGGNGNGFHDGTEPGIAGVTVELLDGSGGTVLQTTTTDANGYYRFDNLPAGNYIVQVAAASFTAGQPLENLTTSPGAEANPNSDVDRNDNGLDTPVGGAIRSGVVTLGPGTTEPAGETDVSGSGQGAPDNRANMTVDFGFVDAFSLGNRVWLDDGTGGGTANNGLQDGTEPGIGGVTVRLFDSTGTTLIATTTTDVNGYYRFDNLPAATYIVEIAASNFSAGNPLNNFSSSTGGSANPNDDVDLDDNGIDAAPGSAVRSGQVTLGPTATEPVGEGDLGPGGQGSADARANMTVDFGFIPPGATYSLGNRVWLDDGTGGGTLNNGVQDGGEVGIPGVSVRLFDGTGTTVLQTTTTDANGYYRFDNLAAGNYIVEIASGNFAAGQPLNNLISSAVTEANPNSDVDRNDNGIDAPVGSPVRSGTVTLGPGSSEPLAEADLGPGGQGSPDDRANMTVDFGFAPPTNVFSLGNRVWLDADNSGTINPADGATPGIGGVTVRLLDSTGTMVIATTTTDAQGYYRFDNLPPGDYVVEIAAVNFTGGNPLSGLGSSTGGEANPNSDIDSNDNGLDTPVAGAIRSGIVTLGPGNVEPINETDVPGAGQGAVDNRANMTVDFGFTTSYSLGNRVWFDTNNNSTLDAGEMGISGVRVELYRDTDGNGSYTPGVDTFINAVTTDGTGYYLFTGIPAGEYVAVIPASNFDNAGDVLNGYFSSGTARTPAGALTETAAPDVDTDTDNDDNGFTTGVLGTAAGYVASSAVTLGPGASEPVGEPDATSATFTDTSPDNRSNTTLDFGFYTMRLGNQVWDDVDDSGTLNGGEAGIDGVLLELFPAGSVGGTPLATTTTSGGGFYTFSGLPAGEYVVRIAQSNFFGILNGYVSSTPTADSNTGVDSDDNGDQPGGVNTVIVSTPINLVPGGAGSTPDDATGRTTNNTVDLGVRSNVPLTYSLGNRVWLDFNNDGLQDTTEPGLGNVQVRLLDAAGNPVDDPNLPGVQDYIVTTDGSGYYRFDNLPPGAYRVQVIAGNFTPGQPLDGYLSSGTDEAVPNSDVDRNDNGIGTTPDVVNGIVSGIVTLGPGEPLNESDLGTGGQGAADSRANMTVDFGFTPPAQLIITKDDGYNAIVVGTSTTYTINIFNNTALAENNVNFQDTVPTADPDGFDPATIAWTCTSTPAGLCPTTSGTNANINETIATIPPGGRVIYRITARLRANHTAATIANTAQIVAGPTATDTNGVIYDPPVGAKMGTAIGTDRIRWEMTWINTGAAQQVVITDVLPANQTFAGNLACVANGTSQQVSCGFANGSITWAGTIDTGPANSVVISYEVTVAGGGTYDNLATLTSPGTNMVVTAAATVVVGEVPGTGGGGSGGSTGSPPSSGNVNVSIRPSVGFAAPGSPIDWFVDIDNISGSHLTNVVITVTFLPDIDILGVDAPPGAIVAINGRTVTITIANLPPGKFPTIVIHTRVNPAAKVPFSITATASVNTCACEASATVVSVKELPATGEPHTWSFGGLLAAGSIVAVSVVMVMWWRRRRWQHV